MRRRQGVAGRCLWCWAALVLVACGGESAGPGKQSTDVVQAADSVTGTDIASPTDAVGSDVPAQTDSVGATDAEAVDSAGATDTAQDAVTDAAAGSDVLVPDAELDTAGQQDAVGDAVADSQVAADVLTGTDSVAADSAATDAEDNDTIQPDTAEATLDATVDATVDAEVDAAVDVAYDITLVACPDGCDDGNVCTDDSCGAQGCEHVANTSSCADDDDCTIGDTCLDSACVAGPDLCECKSTAACKGKDTPALCDGSLYCDLSAAPYVCKVNPASVPNCAPSADPCRSNTCLEPYAENNVSDKAVCQLLDSAIGTPCSDGNDKTVGDVCVLATCVPGTDTALCAQDADCQAYEDGNACNGTLFCNKAEQHCQINPATVVVCPSAADTECSKNTCDPTTGTCGMVDQNELLPCDDANVCTSGEACVAGVCKAEPGANTCICTSDTDCKDDEDGDLCNGTMYCNLATQKCEVNPASVVTCPTGLDTDCSKSVCDKLTGQCNATARPDNSPCNADDNACTVSDVCQAGTCIAGDNACECQNDADCASKEDGNQCNGLLYCDKDSDTCVINPATLVVCSSAEDTACATNLCNPITGQCGITLAPDNKTCSDDQFCTVGDVCKQGSCSPGPNACECLGDTDCASKENGNVCDGILRCNAATGTCVVDPLTIVTCQTASDSQCMANLCQPLSGDCKMTPINVEGPCTDGEPCTLGDICTLAGVCKPGEDACSCQTNADCAPLEDDNLCNGTLFCDKTAVPYACAVKPGSELADATPCDDGDACTDNDRCKALDCAGDVTVVCDDLNLCTSDSCESAVGCIFAANNLPCDDTNPCTENDLCVAKACVSGLPKSCDDANVCTDDSCSPTGICLNVANAGPCEDGEFCTANSCADSACQATPTQCGDNATCNEDENACQCNKFYAGNGQSCTPLIEDECALEKADCGAGLCQDLLIGYACQCPEDTDPGDYTCTQRVTLGNTPRTRGAYDATSLDGFDFLTGDIYDTGSSRGMMLQTNASSGSNFLNLDVAGFVYAVLADGNGGVYIGGTFSHVGGFRRRGIAHILSDGSLDLGFDPDLGSVANASVRAMALSFGTLYIGGTFSKVGGLDRANLAAVDAATGAVTNWNPGTDAIVRTMALTSTRLLVGGDFGQAGGQTRSFFAAFSLSTGNLSTQAPAFDAKIWSIVTSGNDVWVGGEFTTVGVATRNRIARLDSALAPTAFVNTATGYGKALALWNGNLVVGRGDSGTKNCNLSVVDGATGTTLSGKFWSCGDSGNGFEVRAVAVVGDVAYLGGGWAGPGGGLGESDFPRVNAAAVNLSTKAGLAWAPTPTSGPYAIAESGGAIWLGGHFHSSGSFVSDTGFASASGSTVLDGPGLGAIGGRALAGLGGKIAVGGTMATPKQRLAFYDVASKTFDATNMAMSTSTGHGVFDLATWSNHWVVGGKFTSIGSQSRTHLALVDATSYAVTSWNPVIAQTGTLTPVQALHVAGNTLYVGGNFTSASGQARANAAAYDLTTGALLDYNPGADSNTRLVRAFASTADAVYIGGSFLTIGGESRKCVAKTDPITGAVDTAFDAKLSCSQVRGLHVMGNKLLIVGWFHQADSQQRFNLAVVDAATGALDPFTADIDPWPMTGVVEGLQVFGSTAYVSGTFFSIAGRQRSGFAKLSLSKFLTQ